MTPLLAYFGPETTLPAASIIATVLGVVLMMGKTSLRWTFGLIRSTVDACLGRKPKAPGAPATPTPHFTATTTATTESSHVESH